MPVCVSASVHASFKKTTFFFSIAGALMLAGCTSPTGGSATLAPLSSDLGQPAQAKKAPVNMSKVRQYKLFIAPIIGAPLEVVTPLSLRFDEILKTQSIKMAANMETDTDYILKGYFSNLTENNQTTVLYVWDVMDKQGNRVHRLQGQEKVSGKNGWAAVPATVMRKIADDTLTDYFRWVSASAQ